MITVGGLIEQLQQFPAAAILALDVHPTDENLSSVELSEDVATYLDELGDIKSGPIVIMTVS